MYNQINEDIILKFSIEQNIYLNIPIPTYKTV